MPLLPEPAQYLLRIDDLCPTVDAERWARLRALVRDSNVCPLLAVVPENRDTELNASPPAPGFWEQMRAMEQAGATIALHGYRHVCAAQGKSLVPLHRRSEFAGISETTQRAWIHAGAGILRGHGLAPRVWVAPRHGFDSLTLKALRAEGIECVCDGMARIPFVRGGMTWIPQQLWEPVERARGLWTICIHPNTVQDPKVEALREFLSKHRARFTSIDRVAREFSPRELPWSERIYEALSLRRKIWRFRCGCSESN